MLLSPSPFSSITTLLDHFYSLSSASVDQKERASSDDTFLRVIESDSKQSEESYDHHVVKFFLLFFLKFASCPRYKAYLVLIF